MVESDEDKMADWHLTKISHILLTKKNKALDLIWTKSVMGSNAMSKLNILEKYKVLYEFSIDALGTMPTNSVGERSGGWKCKPKVHIYVLWSETRSIGMVN